MKVCFPTSPNLLSISTEIRTQLSRKHTLSLPTHGVRGCDNLDGNAINREHLSRHCTHQDFTEKLFHSRMSAYCLFHLRTGAIKTGKNRLQTRIIVLNYKKNTDPLGNCTAQGRLQSIILFLAAKVLHIFTSSVSKTRSFV